MREERVALEHGVHVALVGRHLGHVDPIQEDLTLARPLEPGDHPQGRGLAASRRSEQGEELTGRHLQVDPRDRGEVTEALHQLDELNLSPGHRSRSIARAWVPRSSLTRRSTDAMMAPMQAPDATSLAARAAPVRRSVPSLLAGYWTFGQFWGVWVIVVFEFQRLHGISDAGIGLSYTLLSMVGARGDARRRAPTAWAPLLGHRPLGARRDVRRDDRARRAAERRDLGRVRARRGRQRTGGCVPERRGPTRRIDDPPTGAAVDARDVRPRRRDGGARGGGDPVRGDGLPPRARVRGHDARDLDRVDGRLGSPGAERGGRRFPVVDLGAVPLPGPGRSRRRRARLVPDRGVHGRVGGAVPARSARRVGDGRGPRVRGVRGLDVRRAPVRRAGAVRHRDVGRRSSWPVSAR